MSLTTLPEEVLESILLHVNTEDISSVLSVMGREGSEGFWRKICLQNGYKKLLSEDENWKCVFYRNISWLKGSYVKSEYNISDLPIGAGNPRSTDFEGVGEPPANNPNHSHLIFNLPLGFKHNFVVKRNKLLYQKQGEVLLMDVENPKILLQSLQGVYHDGCNRSRTKLLLRTSLSLVVYSSDGDCYKELFLRSSDDYCWSSYILTDDYFAVLKTAQRSVTVVDLNNVEEYSLPVSLSKARPFNLSVCNRVLNLVVLDGTDYVLRRYDLERREWLEDILLFRGAMMIEVPQVKMNHRAVVSWSLLLEGRGTTLLKIWTLEDNASHRTSTSNQLNPENVLWLILEADYLIYSSTKSSFSISNLNEPDELESMAMCENDYLGQKVFSNCLVLSYKNCFKLVDFKKATYLYEVLFDCGFEYKQFCVNEHFYIAYNTSCDDEGHNRLCIYDFRGQPVIENEGFC